MKKGDIVRYREYLQKGEEKLLFQVLEDRGNRVLIVPVNLYGLRYLPQECVLKNDIISIGS